MPPYTKTLCFDLRLTFWPAISRVCVVCVPLVNSISSVLFRFSLREFATLTEFLSSPECVVSILMLAALMSSILVKLPTFRLEMVNPYPELLKNLTSEPTTAMKRVGDSADHFTPCFTGKPFRWSKDWDTCFRA